MEILDYLMKELKKKKVDEAVLSFVTNNSRQIKFANNKIVKTGVEELKDVGVFVVKDKKIVSTGFRDVMGEPGTGTAEFTNINKKQVRAFMRKLMSYLKAVSPKEDYNGLNNKKFRYKEVSGIYDSKVEAVDDVDIVEKGINAALKEAKRTNGILEVHDIKSDILTSHGVKFNEKQTELYFSIRSFNKKDESGHMNASSTCVKGFDVEGAGRSSGEIAKDARNPIKGKKGKYDVIFSPLAFAPLLNNVGEASSIFSVETGMSFFGDKLNEKVGCKEVTLYDEGSLKEGIGSTKADEEGVPTQKTVLIDKGIFKSYLHNTCTARKYNVESTGNAGIITPSAWNLVLKTGERGLDKMLKSIKEGIYVTNLYYTRFSNYHTGDFSTIPRDGIFLIKNGEIVKSLKGIRVSENLLNVLKNISETGKDAVHLRSWEADTPVLCPHVLVKDCNVTTPD
ncbi:MAG: TldE-like protein [Nanoarchaeota archaeon]|nr:TldE-like protein [Nanoarchaeota archaeon]|tara:strand:- start:17538 stop:18893 length:1356 start_codon:yes stop_codon:yes gene_type:complete